MTMNPDFGLPILAALVSIFAEKYMATQVMNVSE